VLLGLRQSQGVDLTWFLQRFGKPLSDVYPVLVQQWLNQDKLVQMDRHLRLTPAGLSLADDIAASFLL
jgi:oxygen-independent coproporphyrinogen-3 oxidase